MRLISLVCAFVFIGVIPIRGLASLVTFTSGNNSISSPLESSFPPVVVATGTASVSVTSTVIGDGSGTDDPALLAQGNAAISVLGGSLLAQGSGANGTMPRAGIELQNASSLLFVSGSIGEGGSGDSLDRAGILAEGSSHVSILGGSIFTDGSGLRSNTYGIDALGNSQVSISGGTITVANNGGATLAINAADSSQVKIFGNNFNFPLGAIVPLSGTLTGTLPNGGIINWAFSRASTASITLVPEPSTITLLALGAVGLAAMRRRALSSFLR
jgi:PEP-CTERM motif